MHAKIRIKKNIKRQKKHNPMRKIFRITPLILFISLLPAVLFSSCDKDTNCYIDVLVRDEISRNPVSGVSIEIKQEGGVVHANGITGANGIFSTHFIAPAIVIVKADLPVENGGHRRNETSIRLKEGETVTANITLPIKVEY